MTELLVTNIEQEQPEHADRAVFKIYGRDEDGDTLPEVTVYGFEPYFYAPTEEVKDIGETYLLANESVRRFEHGHKSLGGVELTRIYVPYPQDTRTARELFDEHYSADVPFVRRFMVDTGIRDVISIPDSVAETDVWDVHYTEIEPRGAALVDATPTLEGGRTGFQDVAPQVVTVDIEVDDSNGFPAAGEERILSIVAHDARSDEAVAWIDLNGRAIEDTSLAEWDADQEWVDEIHVQDSERKMLIDFFCWVDEVDPDILTGWNVEDFDFQHILQRAENVGVNPTRMARGSWAGIGRGPRIKGRTIYDLLTAYDKNHHTELDSYKLDDIAKSELGEEKLKFEGTVMDLYENDPAQLIRYNARDVRLTHEINEEAGVIKFRDVLRRQVGVLFEESLDNKDIVDMMCRRKLHEWDVVGPSRPAYGEEPDADYEGAFVFDPYSGVANNVVALDVASLYPYTMAMLNASPDTKIGEHTERPFGVVRAAGGQEFRQDKEGLFPSLVEDAISLKSEYKKQLKAATSTEERAALEVKYIVAKTITNSLYGVTGWARFFLFDKDVAEAVTLTGQEVIRKTAEFVEDVAGHKVIYGDTDSVYIQYPDEWDRERVLEDAHSIAEQLNKEEYPAFAEEFGIPAEDNLWEIEVEAYLKTYFQAGKKKRYAYMATWKDGHEIEDPEPSVVGFELKRSDTAQITNDLQTDVFAAVLEGNDDEIGDIIHDYSKRVTEETNLDYIGIPSGINQEIDPEHAGEDGYYSFSEHGFPSDAHPRGCWNANKILGTNYGSGDKPKRVYLKPSYFEEVEREIDVICFDEAFVLEPIRDDIRIDTHRMLKTVVARPVSRIARALDIDVDAAIKGQQQTGLGAWS